MANPEHLKILIQGVEIWNEWRDENPGIIPDLSSVDFKNENLNTVDFSKTNLIHSDLRWTHLVNVDLNQTLFRETIFGFTNLKNAKNLESSLYFGPNTIDLRTIKLSWPLPKEFLQGCGFSDDYIKNLTALVKLPIQYYSCFISCSDEDKEFIDRLNADLQDIGVRCWIFTEDQKIGDKLLSSIDKNIRLKDKLLLVLSKNSINSDWVGYEVDIALEEERKRKGTVLFPVRLDDTIMDTDQPWAALVRKRYIGDFREWKNHDKYQKAFERLLRDLKAEE